jgi:hypothetical protein
MTVPHAGLQTPADSGRCSNTASAPEAGSLAEKAKTSQIADSNARMGLESPSAAWDYARILATQRCVAAASRRRIKLIYALRDLALTRIGSNLVLPQYLRCLECGATEGPNIDLLHAPSCRAGRALAIVEEIEDFDSNSTRKETAQVPEAAGAGDGKRPLGLFGEPWEYRIDEVLQTLTIYDGEGTAIAPLSKCDRESIDWAARIVDCVNSCAGMEDTLAQCNAIAELLSQLREALSQRPDQVHQLLAALVFDIFANLFV